MKISDKLKELVKSVILVIREKQIIFFIPLLIVFIVLGILFFTVGPKNMSTFFIYAGF